MTLVLVTIFAIDAGRALESRDLARRVPKIVDISTDLFTAIQNFRVERGTVNTALATPDVVDPDAQNEIGDLRVRSVEALDVALRKLDAVPIPGGVDPAIKRIGARQDVLIELRPSVDAA